MPGLADYPHGSEIITGRTIKTTDRRPAALADPDDSRADAVDARATNLKSGVVCVIAIIFARWPGSS